MKMDGVYGSRTQLLYYPQKKMEPPDHQNHTLNLRVGTKDLGQSNAGREKVHPHSASGSFQRWDPPPNTQHVRLKCHVLGGRLLFLVDSDFQ